MSERDYLMALVSKVVVRTPTRLVRMMSDRVPRDKGTVDFLAGQMAGKHGFDNPVQVSLRRQHNIQPMWSRMARVKNRTRYPTPKLWDGHHRLAIAEQSGKKSMLVDYKLKHDMSLRKIGLQSDGQHYHMPPDYIPKDRTREVAAGAVLGAVGVGGGAAYAASKRKKAR